MALQGDQEKSTYWYHGIYGIVIMISDKII